MKNFHLVPFILIALLFASGCDTAPSGFPKKLSSCHVTVTDGGKPIGDVTVNFISDKVTGGVVVGGMTDSSGKATIRTQHGEYSREGAPLEEFKIVLSTPLSVDMPTLTPEERFAMKPQQLAELEKQRQAKIDAIRIIPKKLSSPAATPLTLTVGSDAAKLDVDISQYK